MAVKELLTRFFDAYLVRRDLESAMACLSDGVISLGTGAQEIALDKGGLRKLMLKEFAEIPDGFRYEISKYCERQYREGLSGVFCNMTTTMSDGSGGELSFQTRLTMTAAKLDGEWRILNLHMSTPSDQQEGEEFFPIKYGRRAIGKLDATAGRKLIELMFSMLPGGIMGGYLEKGLPLYIINDTMLDYLGYTYEELVEATGEEMQKVIAPEDWDRVKTEIFSGIEKNGEYDVRYRVVRKDGTRLWVNDKGREIITEDGRRAMVSVMLDISEGVRIQEKLKKEVMEDPLTGILNRKGAVSRIGDCLMHHEPGAMLMLDIDNFKHLNDTYGHQTGDQVLVLLADLMRKNIRANDVIARIGGDEFILFLPGCIQEEILRKKADRICSEFCREGKKYDKVRLSVSIGIAVGDGNSDFDQLLKKADDKLYEVKKNGKGNFR